MRKNIDNCDFTCMVCMEHHFRNSKKPRQGWICQYLARHDYCPSLKHVLFREQDEELSWLQMQKDFEKNKRKNEEMLAREAAGEKTIHQMYLKPHLFEAVEKGTKTVELRLDDAKSRWIREGDLIKFVCDDDFERSVMVEVTAKNIFVDFEESLESNDARSLGFTNYPPEKICQYLKSLYDEHKILASHIVAFELKLL